MTFRLSDQKVIGLLVLALVVQIAVLLWHLELVGFSSEKNSQAGAAAAGKITRVQKALKRRPLDSLIWEESEVQQNLYFHDSVLTLSGSSAKIELENGTRISLSENTLITIEPPADEHSSDIKIVFQQGSINARNPYDAAVIKDDNLTLNLKKDSEVEVFKDDRGEIDVQVKKGEVSYQDSKSEILILPDEILKISAGVTSKRIIQDDLLWIDAPTPRLYTHSGKVALELKWLGSAQLLEVKAKKSDKKIFDLSPTQDKFDLSLPVDEYRISLVSEKVSSSVLSLEVWPAPIIHLVEPHPRNRAAFGHLRFIWDPPSEISDFQLKVIGKKTKRNIATQENVETLELDTDDDLNWGVWGKDADGYLIPPLYEYPLYIRQNPFAPPKLNKPKKIKKEPRRPTNGFLDLLFFKSAHAAEKNTYEALFSWEPVPGAEIYILEISETQDFRKPIVTKKIKDNRFLWQGVDSSKEYYWRVAAGDLSGRLGIFTEPTPVELVEPAPVEPSEPKVVVKKAVKTEPKQPTPKTGMPKDQRVTSQPPSPSPKDVRKPQPIEKLPIDMGIFRRAQLWYAPSYSNNQFTAAENTKATFSGMETLAAGMMIETNWREETLFMGLLKVSQASYDPSPKSAFPFQDQVSLLTADVKALWSPRSSGWAYGVNFGLLPNVERFGFENIKSRQSLMYGATLGYFYNRPSFEYQGTLALVTSDGLYGGQNTHRFFYKPFSGFILAGIEAEAYYLTGTDQTSMMLDFSVLLGIEF